MYRLHSISIYILLAVCGAIVISFTRDQNKNEDTGQTNNPSFTLKYFTIGLGINQFFHQPVFKVTDSQYLFTREKTWSTADQNRVNCDTLHTGNLRRSSIDSICEIIAVIQDSVVYKFEPFHDGTITELIVSNNSKTIRFTLKNTGDKYADAIVSILNSNLPKGVPDLRTSFPE